MAGKSGEAKAPVLLWFRRDLRLSDNPALAWALSQGAPVIPVYVDDAAEGREPGGAARWWLDKSLRALDADLKSRGSRLIQRSGKPEAVLKALSEETRAGGLAFNRLHTPGAAQRENAVRAALKGTEVVDFAANWLVEPGEVLTGQGGPYKVFTPFSRALNARYDPPLLDWAPDTVPGPDAWPDSEDIDAWALHPTTPDWSVGFEDWRPGEDGARERLADFVDERLRDYRLDRDQPGREGGSRLSPHLRFGEIAPWRVLTAVRETARRNPGFDTAAEKFAGEIAWRDFAAHLLRHFPTMPERNMREPFDCMAWRKDEPGFRAWSRGMTGYPIVDAGMRQLWRTGWMHNRVRMIVASFLVKDLLIDWREGEAWFWDTLVDADPANNAMNWQWAAGSGVDAAPFFRVFNPVTQGERFDAAGAYVRRWVPQLSALPDKWIHKPWAAPAPVLDEAGIVLGKDYPRPVVDHAAARERALEAYRALK